MLNEGRATEPQSHRKPQQPQSLVPLVHPKIITHVIRRLEAWTIFESLNLNIIHYLLSISDHHLVLLFLSLYFRLPFTHHGRRIESCWQ
ncbi:hypothetical protein EYC80_004029 [Monilinia laxa]|uniref:Uncharacterized protein n=1 Tax=Monilinia laxa TaxID=61186 RepID=A0A5N6KM15_MONLA|nr:hypothetical protein EYC80_004029 [Monilinia laxa]